MKSSSVLYQPPPSATIHSILPAQTTFFTVSLYNLNPSPSVMNFVVETSWSRTLHYILHTFLHPIVSFFTTYHRSLFCCSIKTMWPTSSLSLIDLYLEHLSFSFKKLHKHTSYVPFCHGHELWTFDLYMRSSLFLAWQQKNNRQSEQTTVTLCMHSFTNNQNYFFTKLWNTNNVHKTAIIRIKIETAK